MTASTTPKRLRERIALKFAPWLGKPHEGREGIVEVYGSTSGEYLGCMGVETWRNYLLEEATRHLFSQGRCHIEREMHFHGPGDTCECGARPNTAWADPTPFSEGAVRP